MAGWRDGGMDGRKGGGGWRRDPVDLTLWGWESEPSSGLTGSCKFSGGAEGFGGVGSAAPSPSTAESLVWSAAKTSSAAATCAKCQSRRQEAVQPVGTGCLGPGRTQWGWRSAWRAVPHRPGGLGLGTRDTSSCPGEDFHLLSTAPAACNPPIPLEPRCCPCPEQPWSIPPLPDQR